jgi:phosphopantothenoylcysteine decarboxylase/phosphopantothenate--cysteine ligase
LRILLGITGGIAAYKAAGLIRGLSELGHSVNVVPTENALRFIGKPTLESLSGNPIDIDMYNDVAQVRHVELGQQADLVLIAPATASFLAKLSAGIADDLLMNAVLASKAPVVVCPAMHSEMWLNQATQENVEKLEKRGIRVMHPATGRLTGQDSGVGRLPEVEDIIMFVLGGPLSGKRVLITAGGTREAIDEVRFIGNKSSGRMGIELAIAARDLGANVTLIAANLDRVPPGVEVIRVVDVDELEEAMDRTADLVIMAAAVSDFRVSNPYRGKLDRSQALSLDLTPTKDLIAAYAAKYPDSYKVAFALADAETDLEATARQKLWDKGVQVVVANWTEALGAESTEVLLVDADDAFHLVGSKRDVAHRIVDEISERLAAQ